MEIRVAHSPDSDDAFMFYALASGKLDTGELRFTHVLEDIESLNRKALEAEYEVTAISIHAYAYVCGNYALLPSGASMGDRYGPIIVSRQPVRNGTGLAGMKVAVPGAMTTAYLTLRLYERDFEPVFYRFDRIIEAVQNGDADAGLLIHEGQLTYTAEGLHKVVDLGEWWFGETALPLPLGGNAIRRDLGSERIGRISSLLRQSIQYGLEHRQDALRHSLSYARGLDESQADRFVGMYVNARTLDYGPEGRRAVQLLLQRAFEAGIIPRAVEIEFTE